MRTTRNVLVIVVLAAAVDVLPGAGRAASVLSSLLQMVFLGGLGWFAYRLYREHRVGIFSLGDRMRGLLYASLVVAVLAAAFNLTPVPDRWRHRGLVRADHRRDLWAARRPAGCARGVGRGRRGRVGGVRRRGGGRLRGGRDGAPARWAGSGLRRPGVPRFAEWPPGRRGARPARRG